MFCDVEEKIAKKNKLLFNKKSKSLRILVETMDEIDHRSLILWAFDCSRHTLDKFEKKYPNEKRPRNCYEKSLEWSYGNIKMPEAKKAILECHRVAKEINDPVYSAYCHGIAQACSTVHVKEHAFGLVIYELTAMVLENGREKYENQVTEQIKHYLNRLLFFRDNKIDSNRKWAKFLMK